MTDTTGFTRVHTVTVPVRDQERALAFYVSILGLEKRVDIAYGPGQRWIELAPPGATTTVSLATPFSDTAPIGVDTGIRLATPNADAEHTRLKAAGADVDNEVLRFGESVPPMFRMRDIDGNTLYVVQD